MTVVGLVAKGDMIDLPTAAAMGVARATVPNPFLFLFAENDLCPYHETGGHACLAK